MSLLKNSGVEVIAHERQRRTFDSTHEVAEAFGVTVRAASDGISKCAATGFNASSWPPKTAFNGEHLLSGRRTAALKRECTRRLGRAPYKANGHVTMRTGSAPKTTRGGKWTGLLQRVWVHFKPAEWIQRDEFRYFKRHRCTPLEAATKLADEIAASRRHRAAVDRHNEIMRLSRLEVAA